MPPSSGRKAADILSKEYPPTPLRPQHRSQYLPACQLLPGCESFNKLLLPAQHTHHHQGTQHTGRKGSQQYNDCYYNSIYYKIDIYIYFVFLWTLKERLHNKRKCLFMVWWLFILVVVERSSLCAFCSVIMCVLIYYSFCMYFTLIFYC